jgi:hypothetical protein
LLNFDSEIDDTGKVKIIYRSADILDFPVPKQGNGAD